MLAPVAFLGHITSQPVEAMVRMETDRVSYLNFATCMTGSQLLKGSSQLLEGFTVLRCRKQWPAAVLLPQLPSVMFVTLL